MCTNSSGCTEHRAPCKVPCHLLSQPLCITPKGSIAEKSCWEGCKHLCCAEPCALTQLSYRQIKAQTKVIIIAHIYCTRTGHFEYSLFLPQNLLSVFQVPLGYLVPNPYRWPWGLLGSHTYPSLVLASADAALRLMFSQPAAHLGPALRKTPQTNASCKLMPAAQALLLCSCVCPSRFAQPWRLHKQLCSPALHEHLHIHGCSGGSLGDSSDAETSDFIRRNPVQSEAVWAGGTCLHLCLVPPVATGISPAGGAFPAGSPFPELPLVEE